MFKKVVHVPGAELVGKSSGEASREDFDAFARLFEEPVALEHHRDVRQPTKQVSRVLAKLLHKQRVALVDKVARSRQSLEALPMLFAGEACFGEGLCVGDGTRLDDFPRQVSVFALCDVVHDVAIQSAEHEEEDVEDRVEVHVATDQSAQLSFDVGVGDHPRDDVRQKVLVRTDTIVALPKLFVVADVLTHHERRAKVVEADVDRSFTPHEVGVVAQVSVADARPTEQVSKQKESPKVDNDSLQWRHLELAGNLFGGVDEAHRSQKRHFANHVGTGASLDGQSYFLGRVVQAVQSCDAPSRTGRHFDDWRRALVKVGRQERGRPQRPSLVVRKLPEQVLGRQTHVVRRDAKAVVVVLSGQKQRLCSCRGGRTLEVLHKRRRLA